MKKKRKKNYIRGHGVQRVSVINEREKEREREREREREKARVKCENK